MEFVIYVLISLFSTILVHPLPMLILRLARKKPFIPKKAALIAIADAFVVHLFWFVFDLCFNNSVKISSGAIFLWGFISYNILKAGYKKEPEEQTSLETSPIFSEKPQELLEANIKEKDINANDKKEPEKNSFSFEAFPTFFENDKKN